MPERTDRNEALRLADELVAPIGTQTSYQTAHEAAALLRQLSAERDTLRAEVERLRVDAERYRWLADCNNFHEAICLMANPNLTAHALGEAIDHARTTHKDEG